jgi:hypothetical protein
VCGVVFFGVVVRIDLLKLNPHYNNKNTTPHRKLSDEELNPQNNNKKHNTTQKAKR